MRPAELARAVSAFREAATAASRAANTAPSTSDPAPWGTDPLGAAFEARYAEPARQVPAALTALEKLLRDTADRLGQATRGLTEADDQAARTTRSHGRD